jgi:hypothetical protein
MSLRLSSHQRDKGEKEKIPPPEHIFFDKIEVFKCRK